MSNIQVYFILGIYWPMLVSITRDYTLSQILFALVFSTVGLILISIKKYIFDRYVFKTLCFFIFLSIGIALIGLIADGSLQRSLSDGMRWTFFGIYIAVGYSFSAKDRITELFIIKTLKTYTLVSILFSFAVYIDSAYWLVDLFKGRLSNDELPFHFFRFSGFVGFPTDFGSILSLILCFVLLDKKNQYFTKIEKVLFIVFIGIGLIGSASRGGILQALTVSFLIFFTYIFSILSKLRFTINGIVPFAFITAIIVLAIFQLTNIESIDLDIIRYVDVDSTTSDSSVSHRFLEIDGAFNVLVDKFFLFGNERDNPLGLPVIEGFWTHWILRYSWLGLFIGLAFFIFATSKSLKAKCVLCDSLGYWFISFFVSAGIFSDVLFRFKGPFIYGFIFGYCLLISRNRYSKL